MWGPGVVLAATLACVFAHGRLLVPPSRASAWRSGFATPTNYDDDGLNCGGYYRQYSINHGLCGICGDPYDAPEPRAHELGGKFGQGIIVGKYVAGSLLETTVEITAYHKGFWELKICPDPQNNNQECFDEYVLELEEGGTKYYPPHGGVFDVTYRLPPAFYCEKCVLQWRYTAGNNWGDCGNGSQGLGCGNQETFGACADITISIGSVEPESIAPEVLTSNMNSPLLDALSKGYFTEQQGLVQLLRPRLPATAQKHVRYKNKHKKRKHKKSPKPRKRKKMFFWG